MGAEEDAIRSEIELTRASLDRRLDDLADRFKPTRVVSRSVRHPISSGSWLIPLAIAVVAAILLPRTRVERAVGGGRRKTLLEQLIEHVN